MAFGLFKSKEKPTRSKLRVVRPSKPNRRNSLRKPRKIETENRSDLDDLGLPSFISLLSNSKTGVVVTPKKSLEYSTVFACVDLIASTISIVPLNIYKETGKGKELAVNHDQYYLLRKQPHQMYSRLQWDKLMIVHYLLWGDAVSIINRNTFGRPVSYELVMPWDVTIDKIKDTQTGESKIWYKVDGKTYPSEDVIHYSDLSIDGIKGCGRISTNKESVGLGLALRDYGNELLADGGKTMGYIHGDARITSPEAYRLLTESFLNGYGSDNSVGVLPKGFKYTPFTHPMPPATAEYIASKNFSKEEICTIFRTPPLLIGSTTGVNNSVAETIMRTWLMSAIAPITTMMELELDRKAFRESEKNTHYVKYNLFALDKADIEKTMNALVQGVNNGIYNKDEARAILDRNPIENGLGKDYYIMSNMIELSNAKEFLSQEQLKTGSNE